MPHGGTRLKHQHSVSCGRKTDAWVALSTQWALGQWDYIVGPRFMNNMKYYLKYLLLCSLCNVFINIVTLKILATNSFAYITIIKRDWYCYKTILFKIWLVIKVYLWPNINRSFTIILKHTQYNAQENWTTKVHIPIWNQPRFLHLSCFNCYTRTKCPFGIFFAVYSWFHWLKKQI